MLYTQSHEWVKTEEGVATVGISAYAQKELGTIVYVECPLVGHSVQKGDIIAVLESTKAAVDVYSPVSGVVLESNTRLQEEPGLINSDPENAGWICRIKLQA